MSTTDASLGPAKPIDGPRIAGARVRWRFWLFAGLTLGMSLPLVVGLGLVLAPLEAIDVLLVTLFALNTLWVAAAAATSLIGMRAPTEAAHQPPADWRPRDKTAVLFLMCGEDPVAVAVRVRNLHRDLARSGVSGTADIWVLSDTPEPARAAEEDAMAPLIDAGLVRYRRRATNTRRKPGNIADWIEGHGDSYVSMLVMDADSAMTADRLRVLRYRMEGNARLGLVQSGIALRPGRTRFEALQRLSTRLTGPVFIRGLEGWSGPAGNYWGHNALIRIAAFRSAMHLPKLKGPAPYGGDFLSHDFIEAAWLVRAGWQVAIAPETKGSSESGPETIDTFHRRDRRWCQGNLQHIRALFAHLLHPTSRIHLAFGVQSYLSSPIWLTVILLFLLAGMAPGAVPVLSGALALLLVPKLAAILRFFHRTRRMSRRRIFLRATGAELFLSTLFSPLVMVRQTLSVIAVLIGRDVGWKRPAGRAYFTLPQGMIEAVAGMALVTVAVIGGETPWQALWLTLVAGPLLAAPWLVPWLDAPRRA
ncbi:MAG: glucans biosynthesis glucosyltransferase MdoH [Pseudomonadota bacterium]